MPRIFRAVTQAIASVNVSR